MATLYSLIVIAILGSINPSVSASLNDADIVAINADFDEFTGDLSASMVVFYQNLFRLFPHYKEYFPAVEGVEIEDFPNTAYIRDVQGLKTGRALASLIGKLGDEAATKAALSSLVNIPVHVRIGLKKEDYANAFTTLSVTLEQVLGKDKVAMKSWENLTNTALSIIEDLEN